MARIEIILILAACSPHGAPAPVRVRTAMLAAFCFDPASYGAVPDDGIVDRIAIQSAVNDASAYSIAHPLDGGAPSSQVVCLGAGTWDCARAPVGSLNRFACASVHAGDVTFAGVGPTTIIRLAGDQRLGDIIMLSHDPGSRGGVRDLTVDSTASFGTSEQTHMMGTTGVCAGAGCLPIGPLAYRRIVCVHPAATDGSRKGDCIRLLGSTPSVAAAEATAMMPAIAAQPGTNIYGVLIEDNDFASCARSAIQTQRGVHDVVVRHNRSHCDQFIHGEATGGTVGARENTGIDVSDNDDFGDPNGTSDFGIFLSGTGDPYEGIRIHGNRGDRAIALYRTVNAEIYDTTISRTMLSAYGVIDSGNICSGLHIHDVKLTRTGVAGEVIRLMPHSGRLCVDVRIDSAQIAQGTVGHGIYAESVSGLSVDRVALTYAVAAPRYAAIYDRATAAEVDRVSLSNNTITGPVTYGVLLSAQPYAFGAGVSLTNNTMTGPTTGCYCEGAGGFTAPVIDIGNAMAPWSCVAPH